MLNKTIQEFTKEAASKAPVPGGGGVSALAGSLAASLAEMVTSLTTGKKRYAQYEYEIQSVMKEADLLRELLLKCITEDAEAFEPLAKAYSMDKETEGYQEKMEKCLKDAAVPPYKIMKYCARIIELDEQLAEIGSKLAVSDAATSVMLANGALYGAVMNVIVNTRLMKDREYADRINTEAFAFLKEYSKRAVDCYDAILGRLTNG